jgi:hypothetical protein
MTGLKHRFIQTNGIGMHIAEQGMALWSFCVMAFRKVGTRGGISCPIMG